MKSPSYLIHTELGEVIKTLKNPLAANLNFRQFKIQDIHCSYDLKSSGYGVVNELIFKV